MTIKELNKKKIYTEKQLKTSAKFKGKFLDVYRHNYELWVDGEGYQTVYEVRGISNTIRECYNKVEDIF